MVVSIIVLLFSLFQIFQYLMSMKKTKDLYRDLSGLYHSVQENDKGQKDDNIKTNGDNKVSAQKFASTRLQRLKEVNQDIIGWLTIPNTKIDYPVVLGENNDFYLDHDLFGNKERHGSIFMDYKNDIQEDQNLIIYGHHMKDGTMFKDLVKYKEKDFYEENTSVFLDLGQGPMEYEIFSAYIVRAQEADLWLSFEDDKGFSEYFDSIKEKSLYPIDVSFKRNRKMLTLSTCTYEMNNARFIIHALSIDN